MPFWSAADLPIGRQGSAFAPFFRGPHSADTGAHTGMRRTQARQAGSTRSMSRQRHDGTMDPGPRHHTVAEVCFYIRRSRAASALSLSGGWRQRPCREPHAMQMVRSVEDAGQRRWHIEGSAAAE